MLFYFTHPLLLFFTISVYHLLGVYARFYDKLFTFQNRQFTLKYLQWKLQKEIDPVQEETALQFLTHL